MSARIPLLWAPGDHCRVDVGCGVVERIRGGFATVRLAPGRAAYRPLHELEIDFRNSKGDR